MGRVIQQNFRVRKHFGKIGKVVDIPNLIDIQKLSYEKFLQLDIHPGKREDIGLQGVFKSVFPIIDFSKTAVLDYVSYTLDRPKYDVEECRQRGMTYAAPMRVTMQLVLRNYNEETQDQTIRDVKEQEVYFGEIPLMTEHGTFVINGTERVVVSQLHRSPGVFFDHDKGRTHASGKVLFNARVIPYRGSWLDFEFDAKDLIYVRIDRRRKLHATVLLRALGYSAEELLNYFYDTEEIHIESATKLSRTVDPETLLGQRASKDIKDPASKEVIVKKGRKFTRGALKKLAELKLKTLPVSDEDIVGKYTANDIVDPDTGEVVLACNELITPDALQALRDADVSNFKVLFIDNLVVGSFLRDTLVADKLNTPDEAVLEIYRRMRPGDPPTLDAAKALFANLFFNPERYDLSAVGRLKMNHKFGLDSDIDQGTLSNEDILKSVAYLIDLRNGKGQVDDIDHLGNRRVRAVGELMENQYRIGLVRMERAIREKMNVSQEIEFQMPHDLVNAKPVGAIVREYFGSSQLSQFMDQTNPLSEVTHKRRLSALGPGGLTRERAGFEVRDVHTTHYGRVCPIETPEGPNIGLIASLSSYARVNEYGFIETPYRRVENGKVSEEIEFFSALEEEGLQIAQANAEIGAKGNLLADRVSARHNGEYVIADTKEIGLMDVSPNQLVSVAASLIPFLEHDDANRALMGSNMQRQAVPLVKTQAPFIGTGIEGIVARDSGVTVVAKRDGIVEYVDASRIVIRPASDRRSSSAKNDPMAAKPDIYNLLKFQRSNQNTSLNQKPIVQKGDFVKRQDVIADGPATECGELALGQNVLVAFMPWGGYNFEDSILVSERLVKDDVFTSIHIEEFECISRDTKLGPEEITQDIPNLGEEAMTNLDTSGIIRIGAEVKSGDVLVGKITPKGETQLSPEEKLLRAIFGEKAGDVRDTSLRVPPGVSGVVIDAQVFARKGTDMDERSREIIDAEKEKRLADKRDEIRIISGSYYDRMKKLLLKKTTSARVVDDRGKVLLGKGEVLTAAVIDELPKKYLSAIHITDDTANIENTLYQLADQLEADIQAIESNYDEKIARLGNGDELPPGVIKMVKVYVAIKRRLQVGDKMAGRHGNKGVISRILPEEDMPYLMDGTPVDICLNPLGVPSRMNIGQILETHLGWAARELGNQIDRYLSRSADTDVLRTQMKKVYETDQAHTFIDSLDAKDIKRFADKARTGVFMSTPVFDGAEESEIKGALTMAGLPSTGQTTLFDGKTGEPFEQDVTVGIMYVLKLHHLADDKIHARSTGPYSLVTQQPLGGKAQFGGQRLGEMEVWALEAYGAAYGLQEFLTVKSDDVTGRTRMYESIVKGEQIMEAGLPESFNVLLKEFQSLGLNIELIEADGTAREPTAAPSVVPKGAGLGRLGLAGF